ncbi:MAG: polA [Clostridia bacterium]|nr:polA [Clostridia bacterium]
MKLLVLDGNSVLNRAFYGIRNLTTSKGVHTNAVYGFLNILLKHIEEDKPDFVCVAFDLKAKTFRHELFDGYKANRKGMPDELAMQLPVIKALLDALNITRIEKEGMEADDIIGVLSYLCTESSNECIILTGDRDELQLIREGVTVKLSVTKQTGSSDDVYDIEAVKNKYGINPGQLIDLKALMGDASDNIPGVHGIGEKTALSLLVEYGSLDNIYNNINNIKSSVKDKLIEGKESAYMSKTLGTIMTHAPLNIDFKSFKPAIPDKEKLLSLLNEYELFSLIKRFDFKSEIKQELEEITLLDYIPQEHARIFEQSTLYLLYKEDFIYIKDIKNGCVIKVPLKEAFTHIKGQRLVTHDAKPLISIALKYNIKLNILFDTMLAAYVLNPSVSSYPLTKLYSDNLEKSSENIAFFVYYFDELYKKMESVLQNNNQENLYKDIELPLCSVLAEMEYQGFMLDKVLLLDLGNKMDSDIKELTDLIYTMAEKEFNINSTKQLGTILFENLNLPYGRKTKTGYSTDNEVLEKLIYAHPIIENIIQYRKLTKLKTTYIDGLLKKIGDDMRIHTIFTQTVTQTGRISSIEPNLQNIPIRTEIGRQLRKVFIAKEGCVLLDADYSQIELRILAHIADDKVMLKAFEEGADIHTITASQVFNLPPQLITPQLRNRAKAVNFGIVYGIGDYSLSQDIGVTRKEAKIYIDNYLKTYSGVRHYMESIVEYAKKNGYVETIFGRRRYIPDIHAKNKQLQAFAERISMNTPIQGTAADLIKLAMIRVTSTLKEKGLQAKLILQVHDELILETPESEVEIVKEILKYEMEHAASLNVPVIADVGTGINWYDAKA